MKKQAKRILLVSVMAVATFLIAFLLYAHYHGLAYTPTANVVKAAGVTSAVNQSYPQCNEDNEGYRLCLDPNYIAVCLCEVVNNNGNPYTSCYYYSVGCRRAAELAEKEGFFHTRQDTFTCHEGNFPGEAQCLRNIWA